MVYVKGEVILEEKITIKDISTIEKIRTIEEIRMEYKVMIAFIIISLIMLLFGIKLMFSSHSTILKIIGFILFILGLLFSWAGLSSKQNLKKELVNGDRNKHIADRIEHIIDKIGGAENIDINLSKYDDRNQLIILKNKSILIGYNNYETEKIISFDSIIHVDIRINNIKKESEAGYTHYHRDVIESIIAYIHTNECTEELVFKYSSYETNQEKYNEILKNLNRFKVMLEDTLDRDNLDSKTNINYKEKSIPEQIKEYKELLDIDAITKEEYQLIKKDLLSKLRS